MYVFSELRNITKIRKGIKKSRETETDRERKNIAKILVW